MGSRLRLVVLVAIVLAFLGGICWGPLFQDPGERHDGPRYIQRICAELRDDTGVGQGHEIESSPYSAQHKLTVRDARSGELVQGCVAWFSRGSRSELVVPVRTGVISCRHMAEITVAAPGYADASLGPVVRDMDVLLHPEGADSLAQVQLVYFDGTPAMGLELRSSARSDLVWQQSWEGGRGELRGDSQWLGAAITDNSGVAAIRCGASGPTYLYCVSRHCEFEGYRPYVVEPGNGSARLVIKIARMVVGAFLCRDRCEHDVKYYGLAVSCFGRPQWVSGAMSPAVVAKSASVRESMLCEIAHRYDGRRVGAPQVMGFFEHEDHFFVPDQVCMVSVSVSAQHFLDPVRAEVAFCPARSWRAEYAAEFGAAGDRGCPGHGSIRVDAPGRFYVEYNGREYYPGMTVGELESEGRTVFRDIPPGQYTLRSMAASMSRDGGAGFLVDVTHGETRIVTEAELYASGEPKPISVGFAIVRGDRSANTDWAMVVRRVGDRGQEVHFSKDYSDRFSMMLMPGQYRIAMISPAPSDRKDVEGVRQIVELIVAPGRPNSVSFDI